MGHKYSRTGPNWRQGVNESSPRATEFGDRANEDDQLRYFNELKRWAAATNTTIFFFEAFDEPWKGDENDPLGAEKHWGLFFVDRRPKKVMR